MATSVVLDPAPYQYVYGWAALPAVVGIASVSSAFVSCFPAAIAVAILGVSAGYTVQAGQAPRTSSYFRLTFDARLDQGEIARTPTAALVAMLLNDRRQKSLANQLDVRSELCRRLRGKVLATFDTHPVCLDDALFYWQRLPALVAGEAPRVAMSRQDFERAFTTARPHVFIWGRRWEEPRALLPWANQMLVCCYDVGNGFAVARNVD